MALSKSQINKLGRRLRRGVAVDEETLVRLQHFRAQYDAPMAKAQSLIANSIGLYATSRLKTINTIVDKLRREKTRLAEMQDIAGLRLVLDGDFVAPQNNARDAICSLFPGAEVVDRRRRPRFGYRAVHIIAVVDGYPVEIQIRTHLQDVWAQVLEKLADVGGRRIRYGGRPRKFALAIRAMMRLSRGIAVLERGEVQLKRLERSLAEEDETAHIESLRKIISKYQQEVESFESEVHSAPRDKRARRRLEKMRKMVDEVKTELDTLEQSRRQDEEKLRKGQEALVAVRLKVHEALKAAIASLS